MKDRLMTSNCGWLKCNIVRLHLVMIWREDSASRINRFGDPSPIPSNVLGSGVSGGKNGFPLRTKLRSISRVFCL